MPPAPGGMPPLGALLLELPSQEEAATSRWVGPSEAEELLLRGG